MFLVLTKPVLNSSIPKGYEYTTLGVFSDLKTAESAISRAIQADPRRVFNVAKMTGLDYAADVAIVKKRSAA